MYWQMYAGLQATMHNAWLRGENTPPYKPADFLPDFAQPQLGPGEKPDAFGRQSVSDKRVAIRSMLRDAWEMKQAVIEQREQMLKEHNG